MTALVNLELQREIEHFLSYEAHLLDTNQLVEWDALFTPDGMYWMPLAHGQEDPLNHASIAYEDAILRDVRIRRLAERHAWSQLPPTYSSHQVTNAIVTAHDEAAGTLTVQSRFQVIEWRKRNFQRHMAGGYVHELVNLDGAWRIKLKRVNLVNCDGVHDNFELFV
jgi:benzoate/toluate 1,2-dioxygenase beta subunit